MKNITINKLFLMGMTFVLFMVSACEKETIYDKTRLFRPVLGSQLEVVENTIEVSLGKIKEATGYTVEVSRDSFKIIDYTVKVDSNVFVLNEALLGEALLYNTLYQIRVTAHALDAQYDSRPADLGSVRTERFPSIQQLARIYDVTDTKAKVRWIPSGAAITKVKIFATSDLRLKTPLAEYDVPESAQSLGEFIIDKLKPATSYQVAIYSGNTLRGWVDYKTLVAGVDPNAANVVDLSETEDPDALEAAVKSAQDGGIVLLKKGITYNFPTTNLNKSITIKGAYGFTENKAAMFTTGNWNLDKVTIDHIVFDDIELIGEDIGGDYVFNPSNAGTPTIVNELRFENCIMHHFRGIIRIRSDVFVKNYIISNSIVHHIGGYGIFTCDTDGDGKAAIDNVKFTNSTFYKINTFMTSRQNCQSFIVDACTVNEAASTNQNVFRFRGAAGKADVLHGFSITNTIWGHGWDEAASGSYSVLFIGGGLTNTAFTILNTWGTSDFSATAGKELAGFPALSYSGAAAKLWVDPYEGNFNIKDAGFGGRFDAGDPRWSVKL